MCYVCAARGSMASWAAFDHGVGGSSFAATAPAAMTSVGATGNRNIDALLSGYRWVGSITYSFPDSRSDYESGYTEVSATGFGSVSFNQMQAARFILEGTSAYTGGPRMGLTAFEQFTNASISDAGFNGADIRIAKSSSANPTAYAYYPVGDYRAGDIWFGTQYDYGNPQLGSYAYATMVHELGHALGLKHGHQTGGVSNISMTADRDSLEFSVMTYRSYIGQAPNGYTNETYGYPQTFMMYDIAALQHMYGANFNTNSGNTTYRWDPNTGQTFVNGIGQGTPGANRVFLTIWDGGGIDTYDFSNYTTNLQIDLTPGGWSLMSAVQQTNLGEGNHARGNVFNALQYHGDARSLIENAVGGSGSDSIVGNAADNVLTGNSGNDTLDGASGTDTAQFSSLMSDYDCSLLSGNILRVIDRRAGSPDGTDYLSGIEYLKFADTTVRVSSVVSQPLPNGSGFARSGSWTGYSYGAQGWYVGDFNGDGRDDIFRYAPGSSGADMFLSTGSGFAHSGSWTGAGAHKWYIGDFNNDGKDDVLREALTGTGAEVFLSNGSSFVSAGRWTADESGDQGWYVGNFDGASGQDIFRYVPGYSGAEMYLTL